MTRQRPGDPPSRLTRTLVGLGIVIGIAALAYGAVTQPQALQAMWGRKSWNWLGVLLVLATLATLTQRRTRRPALVAMVAGGGVALAAFGVAATTAVALIVVSAFAVGACVLDRTGKAARPAEVAAPVAATAIGLASLALILGAAAHFPVNIGPGYLGLSALALWLGRRHVAALSRRVAATMRTRQHGNAMPFPAAVALWFGFGLQAYYAALPERYHDALAMHLVIPRALELFGRWHFDFTEYVWAVWPLGADLLFGWAYVLAGEPGAKLLNLALLMLTCGVIVEAKFASRAAALAAAGAFILMPLAIVETGSLFVENALALFLAAAVVSAWRLSSNPAQGSIGLALALAGAVVVKLHGVIAVAAVVLAVVVSGNARAALAAPARAWVLVIIAAILGVSPYAYAWIVTGNPIFPFYNAIFRSPFFAVENFGTNALYPGGLTLHDLYDLTFSSSKYLESWDGALGFVLTLLLPAGLIAVAARGSQALRLAAVTALAYIAAVLLSTRYLRYIYPALPWLFLVALAPLDLLKDRGRAVVMVLATGAVVLGVLRIPAAGWIIGDVNLAMAFSPRAREAYADVQAPLRAFGRAQAAIGNNDARTAIFGAPVGADIRGRPLFAGWYHPTLGQQLLSVTSADEAARALAMLNATHVIIDLRFPGRDFGPWREAAAGHGRLVYGTERGELYEFDALSVGGTDLLAAATVPWTDAKGQPVLQGPAPADGFALPPGGAVSRPIDVARLRAGTPVMLSTAHACAPDSAIRVQINWLKQNGEAIRTDAIRSECGSATTRGRLRASFPQQAAIAYAYLANDGPNTAQLSDVRLEAITDVLSEHPR